MKFLLLSVAAFVMLQQAAASRWNREDYGRTFISGHRRFLESLLRELDAAAKITLDRAERLVGIVQSDTQNLLDEAKDVFANVTDILIDQFENDTACVQETVNKRRLEVEECVSRLRSETNASLEAIRDVVDDASVRFIQIDRHINACRLETFFWRLFEVAKCLGDVFHNAEAATGIIPEFIRIMDEITLMTAAIPSRVDVCRDLLPTADSLIEDISQCAAN